MRTRRNTCLLGIVILLGVAAVAIGPARAAETVAHGTHGGADIDQMIANAKTPADHEAIAVHFDQLAAEARKEAGTHTAMGRAYKQLGGAVIGKYHMDDHCAQLVKTATEEAKTYSEMAQAERELAKAAK